MSFSTTLGKKIRAIRKTKGLTLSELAKLSGCSTSLISAIERGIANPSIITVKGITDALGLLPSQFLMDNSEAPEENEMIPIIENGSERKVMMIGEKRFELFSRGGGVPFEFVLSEYGPGASIEEPLSHKGSECGLLLEGELQIEFGSEVYHLKPGDSFTFPSSVPHRVSNPGKKKAIAYWVNSVPWLFSTK